MPRERVGERAGQMIWFCSLVVFVLISNSGKEKEKRKKEEKNDRFQRKKRRKKKANQENAETLKTLKRRQCNVMFVREATIRYPHHGKKNGVSEASDWCVER